MLALDFGLRQIGVAVGNCTLYTAEALPILRTRDGQPPWPALSALLDTWAPDLLLVGDPLNMDDSESELARRARRFARQLHGRYGLSVTLVDERLTSFEARQQARAQGHRGDYRRDPIDSEAALLLLESWLREHALTAKTESPKKPPTP